MIFYNDFMEEIMARQFSRKIVFILSFLVISSCASTGETKTQEGISLKEAIEQSTREITQKLPAKTRVAIAAFDSEYQNVSGYIIDELAGALTDSSLEVTDRRNLNVVYKELGFQMSGDVSDETAMSIGKFLGAQYVVIGQFLKTGNTYRYRVSSINVETAVQVSSTRLDVQNSQTLQNMITDLKNNKITAPALYSRPTSPPGTAGAFIDRGILFAVRGDWELAIADFTEAIKLDGNIMAAWAFRARAYSASVSRMAKAEEDFSSVSAVISDAKDFTEEQKKGYNKALADYTQAIKLDPTFAPAYRERGAAYSGLGDYEKAIADYNQALRLNPNDTDAYLGRGNAYSLQGDDNKALADYNRAINIDSNSADAYICRGYVYAYQGNHDRAIDDFTHAIRLNPNSFMSYTNRGNSYSDKGEYDKAIADFNQAIRIEPNYSNAYAGRGTAYNRKGDHDRAITDLTQAIRLDPDHIFSYSNRALAYYYKGDYDKAIADYSQIIRLNPNGATAYADRGHVYYFKGDYDKAIADYTQAVRLDPNNSKYKQWLEETRQKRGR